MAALPAGTFVYTASSYSPSFVERVVLDTPTEIRESPAVSAPRVLGVSNDHRQVVLKSTVGGASRVRIWDLDSDSISAPVNDAYSPLLGRGMFGASCMDEAGGRVLTTGGLLDLAAGEVTPAAGLVTAELQDLQFSPDGARLYVSYNASPWLRCYDVASWSELPLPFSLTATPRTLRVSPDESMIALGFDSLYRARIYSLDSGTMLQSISPGYSDYYSAHFSADGAQVAWSLPSESPSLRVFDVPAEGGFAGPVFAPSGSLYQSFAVLVGSDRVLVPNDYYGLHGSDNAGHLLVMADGSLDRLLLGTVSSVAVPLAYSMPTAPFWTSFHRTTELP